MLLAGSLLFITIKMNYALYRDNHFPVVLALRKPPVKPSLSNALCFFLFWDAVEGGQLQPS